MNSNTPRVDADALVAAVSQLPSHDEIELMSTAIDLADRHGVVAASVADAAQSSLLRLRRARVEVDRLLLPIGGAATW